MLNIGAHKQRDYLMVLLMGGPAFLLLAIFMIAPFIGGIRVSLTNKEFGNPNRDFIGARNYATILGIAVVDIPDKPAALSEDVPPIGWYQNSSGEAIFRWRPRSLDQIGLERYSEYNLDRIIHMFGNDYALLMRDPTFWRVLVNNLKFALFVVPVQSGIALFLAILVNQKLPGMNIYRTVYFMPIVTALPIISVVWALLYNPPPQNGIINQLVMMIGLEPVNWLGDPNLALPAIIITSMWHASGFQMVIFLAGLQSIPEDLYEAAGIDGAGMWHKFRYVTLPMLRNTTVFVILTTTILAFRLFTQVNMMTPNGGTDLSTGTVIWYLYTQARSNQVGYASALSVVFVVIVVLISLIQRALLRSEARG